MGRYAYGNQPTIAQWNLARLAETLLPLLAGNEEAALAEAQAALDAFAPQFNEVYLLGLNAKLGLQEKRAGDHDLAQDLLKRMAEGFADFTLTFRRLADLLDGGEGPRNLFVNPLEFDGWAARWKQRIADEGGDRAERVKAMRAVNPAFVPRNHRIEYALAAAEAGDFSQFEGMVRVLSRPFDDQPEFALYAASPEPDQIVQRTFCGT
ncbi:MAG: protein adenylyltransferase SelO family protein [Rhizomicrobium sp.]